MTQRLRQCLLALAITTLASGLTGCGVVSTTVALTSAAVGVATTAASVAVDGAVMVGKGTVKAVKAVTGTGEVAAEAAK